jgi:hypothetical protein
MQLRRERSVGIITGAAAWVWDFVVGDWLLVGGVIVAVLVAWALCSATGATPRDVAGPLFFVVVAASLALSLWRGTRAA